MAANSKIEWTDHTANFWWGCLKISEGCKNCYAETLSKRTGKNIWGPSKTTQREYKKAVWTFKNGLPKWDADAKKDGKRIKVFVLSMGDFLEDHPMVERWREEAITLIGNLTNTDILLLTKRPENSEYMLSRWYARWPSHVWFGVTVENQKRVNERVPLLLRVPAKVRFLSVEPMLERITLTNFNAFWHSSKPINWVICGGESGPRARTMEIAWARGLKEQCALAGVPFFMKQLGGHPNKRDQIEDFPEDLRVREFPTTE